MLCRTRKRKFLYIFGIVCIGLLLCFQFGIGHLMIVWKCDGWLDFGFLKDRIYGSVEVYQRNTTDLINRIPIAGGSNFSNYLVTNVGNMENKGFEVTLSGVPISTTDFTWNAGVNITRNVNEITKLTKTDDPDYQDCYYYYSHHCYL